MEQDHISYPSVKPRAWGLSSYLLLLQIACGKGASKLGKDCRSVGVTFSAADNLNI